MKNDEKTENIQNPKYHIPDDQSITFMRYKHGDTVRDFVEREQLSDCFTFHDDNTFEIKDNLRKKFVNGEKLSSAESRAIIVMSAKLLIKDSNTFDKYKHIYCPVLVNGNFFESLSATLNLSAVVDVLLPIILNSTRAYDKQNTTNTHGEK